jgi:hypothetical protein
MVYTRSPSTWVRETRLKPPLYEVSIRGVGLLGFVAHQAGQHLKSPISLLIIPILYLGTAPAGSDPRRRLIGHYGNNYCTLYRSK